ncbi:MAG: gamma-glutamyltransferase [Saprospiraceae bacterium]
MKVFHQFSFFCLLLLLSLSACKQSIPNSNYKIQQTATSSKAMVVSAHPLASKVGTDILKMGGNAVDATIAVQFALAVTYPRAGNIGGGGFMLIRQNDGTVSSLDYREKAPSRATRDMYLDSLGNVIAGLSQRGPLAVGVPGSVDGLITAHQKYGKLKDFKVLIEPAIQLAEQGFGITKMEADRLNKFKADFQKFNEATIPFLKATPWKAGDQLLQKELAATLRLIRDQGRAGFYEGVTAEKIVKEMESNNGIISLQDLKNYQSKWRAAITVPYKDYTVYSMPPPSSGGVALAQLLKIVEAAPLQEWGFHATNTTHLMVEAERRVYADRAQHLGDMDFYPVPTDSLLHQDYLQARMKNFSDQQASESEAILAGKFEVQLESFETTHTSVVDEAGNAVSVTTTLNSNYGSKVVVDGAGFFLNNEMDDFSAKPGVPNQFGLIGAEANAIQPEKRMLSSMTPTIVTKKDKVFLVLGTPGGSTIITSVFQVFLNVAEFGMSLEEAVNAKRFHHQWLPDEIMYEVGAFDEATIKDLKAMGHQFNEKKYIGLVKAIQVSADGKMIGVGDARSEDHAAGL